VRLLTRVSDLLVKNGYRVVNVDATVVLQTPKIAKYVPKMISNIAYALGISESCVNVKATTEERLGFTGREEGMAAQAICSLATLYEASMPVGCEGGCGNCGR
jgi:2-C-methyl-D-erythritol 2,4-cyclodiphosphate synthase